MTKQEFEEKIKKAGLITLIYIGDKKICVSALHGGDAFFYEDNPIVGYYNYNGHYKNLEDLLNIELNKNLTLDEYIPLIDKIELVGIG